MASLKSNRFLVLMALFILLVVYPGVAGAQQASGVIYGTVTGPSGAVVQDCKVTVP